MSRFVLHRHQLVLEEEAIFAEGGFELIEPGGLVIVARKKRALDPVGVACLDQTRGGSLLALDLVLPYLGRHLDRWNADDLIEETMWDAEIMIRSTSFGWPGWWWTRANGTSKERRAPLSRSTNMHSGPQKTLQCNAGRH